MTADRIFPTMVAINTGFLPYLSDTSHAKHAQHQQCGVADAPQESFRTVLTGAQERRNDALTKTEHATHRSSEEDDVPFLVPSTEARPFGESRSVPPSECKKVGSERAEGRQGTREEGVRVL
jgi:hypothetical protein